jgi:hypothetical protein
MKYVSVAIGSCCLLAFVFMISGCGTNSPGVPIRTHLEWTTPTTHQDGSPLSPSDIGGYRLYYGTTPGTYLDSIETGTATSVLVPELHIPAGRVYYVSVTAFADGGLESGHSNVVAFRIP